MVAVGGDGTVLSAAHFLDHGTIPMLGVNSDPSSPDELASSVTKQSDERRSHGALCMCTSLDMHDGISKVLYGGGVLSSRARIQTVVKSTFAETRLVPALNDMLIANPSPAAVSRFRMGFISKMDTTDGYAGPLQDGSVVSDNVAKDNAVIPGSDGSDLVERIKINTALVNPTYGTVTRFGGIPYSVHRSINVWSSGMWVSTSTGSSAAMVNAGGSIMDLNSPELQYLVREHMLEANSGMECKEAGQGLLSQDESLHLRWNSQKGTIFIDGSHMTQDLELGDEIKISNDAPPLQLFMRDYGKASTDPKMNPISGLSR